VNDCCLHSRDFSGLSITSLMDVADTQAIYELIAASNLDLVPGNDHPRGKTLVNVRIRLPDLSRYAQNSSSNSHSSASRYRMLFKNINKRSISGSGRPAI